MNRVTERLFEKYRRPEDYLAVPEEELQRDIFATGSFDRRRGRCAGRCACSSRSSTAGPAPHGGPAAARVARKTANVVAAELGEPQGVVVDTHVRRLSQRLGLTKQEDPVKIERDFQKLVPREYRGLFPHLLIWHGRRVCDARNPRCDVCVLNDSARRAVLTQC